MTTPRPRCCCGRLKCNSAAGTIQWKPANIWGTCSTLKTRCSCWPLLDQISWTGWECAPRVVLRLPLQTAGVSLVPAATAAAAAAASFRERLLHSAGHPEQEITHTDRTEEDLNCHCCKFECVRSHRDGGAGSFKRGQHHGWPRVKEMTLAGCGQGGVRQEVWGESAQRHKFSCHVFCFFMCISQKRNTNTGCWDGLGPRSRVHANPFKPANFKRGDCLTFTTESSWLAEENLSFTQKLWHLRSINQMLHKTDMKLNKCHFLPWGSVSVGSSDLCLKHHLWNEYYCFNSFLF